MVQVAVLAVSLSLGLARAPYVGIACPGQPNVTTCGRVGVAVWLKQPALAVSAALAGSPLRLHAGGFGGQGPRYWEGYVRLSQQQLRLPRQWAGTGPVRVLTLKLTIRYRKRTESGAVRVQLRPGWG